MEPNVYVERIAESNVKQALRDSRVVALLGPRQSGKTTLIRRIAESDKRQYLTLDDRQNRQIAQEDPIGLLRDKTRVAIDEIQHAPDLILEIKRLVDIDPEPGRFLITGSVDLFRTAVSPDSLAGRVQTIELFPFSQMELESHKPPEFLTRAFSSDLPNFKMMQRKNGLEERVLTGGYPNMLFRNSEARRRTWIREYVRSLVDQDTKVLTDVGKRNEFARLISYLAETAGQLLNLSRIAAYLQVDGSTVNRWISLLEQMFLVRRIPGWYRNHLKRQIKAPKIHFLDSGLLAALTNVDSRKISTDRSRFGTLLQSFVFSELLKNIAQIDEQLTISHYRDKNGVEVDFVLENFAGDTVGIKVKTGATAHLKDFRGLEHLQKHAVGRFAAGIVLHDGDRIQKFGENMVAIPIKVLWEEWDVSTS